MDVNEHQELSDIKKFYDSVYYKDKTTDTSENRHYQNLATKLGINTETEILDVACGSGEWLLACSQRGAKIAGIDLSEKAIDICRSTFKNGEFLAQAAENLPFRTDQFNIVSCLGSLEHFVDPVKALKEMRRVASQDAQFVVLVPNADFLTRKLKLFRGTYQVDAKEHVRTLPAWNDLFTEAGLTVTDRWKDLHIVSIKWVKLGPWYAWPFRALQAILLTIWPLKWQYQVYHLCHNTNNH
ncbi:methyltransferase domain-containing protein [Zhongshania sp.]|uniref:methyltransferase domain-containing protein n=1 Tax=Zhongshania sp. TaxID=1971902 RepID=UPI001B4B6042|nr:methyltransferase domain-containing protein [Zhongshania sp.]MBQ0797315.1 methyltransferase domain-containing protein [Zhongshania sp.]